MHLVIDGEQMGHCRWLRAHMLGPDYNHLGLNPGPMTLDKLLNLSVPQFPHLPIEDNKGTYHIGLR